MAKEGIEKRRQNEEQNLSCRRLRILEEVFKRGKVSITELQDLLSTKYSIRDPSRTLTRNIKKLQSMGFPIQTTTTDVIISPISMEPFWKGTDVGDRIENLESAESKRSLAASLIRFLNEIKKKEYLINSIMLGTGTTVYYCASELFARWEELRFETIYTASVLVLNTFIHRMSHNISFHMVRGHLDRETAWLRSDQGIEELRRQPVDVVITSFLGLNDYGFITKQDYEIHEKLMNLQPHEDCKLIVIPIESTKIGRKDGELVAEKQLEVVSRGLEDILKDRGERRYVLITSRPSGRQSKEQHRILREWEKRGMEIVWSKKT